MIAIDAGEGVNGVLSLAVDDPSAFDAVDRRVLERVGAQLAPAISNARLYEDIKRMHLGNLKALSSALNAKDYYTLGHAARVAAYMVLLGEELGWSPELLRERRGGRVSARHRQDRRLGPSPAQAGGSTPASGT